MTGIDGDGTAQGIVDWEGKLSGIGDRKDAEHRFRNSWEITGDRLDTVTRIELKPKGGGSKVLTAADGLRFEEGGTAMKRKLLLPATLVAGAFTLILTNAAGDTHAQTFILQGEKGDDGAQGPKGDKGEKGDTGETGPQGIQGPKGDKGDPGTFTGTFVGDVTFDGNVSVKGTCDIAELVVTKSYSLPDCPETYLKDSSRSDIVLCKKGADEMVRVGGFWVDRYEAVIVDSAHWANGLCNGSGTTYCQTGNDLPGSFPDTGNWTAPLYACSKPGLTPSAFMTWFQAQQACELAGKDLCDDAEWQAAAAGTVDPGVFDGTAGGPCTTGASGPRATGKAGATPADPTSCISKYGAEDMIGNLMEWTSSWYATGPQPTGMTETTSFANWPAGYGGDYTWNLSGRVNPGGGSRDGIPAVAVRGGAWADGTAAGMFAMDLMSGPSDASLVYGFRCCRKR